MRTDTPRFENAEIICSLADIVNSHLAKSYSDLVTDRQGD